MTERDHDRDTEVDPAAAVMGDDKQADSGRGAVPETPADDAVDPAETPGDVAGADQGADPSNTDRVNPA